MKNQEEFVKWLQKELDNRGWNKSDLARQTGISRQTISNVMNFTRSPGPDFCNALAKALKVDPVGVFEKAGLINIVQNKSDQEDLIVQIPNLSNENITLVRKFIELLLWNQREPFRIGGDEYDIAHPPKISKMDETKFLLREISASFMSLKKILTTDTESKGKTEKPKASNLD